MDFINESVDALKSMTGELTTPQQSKTILLMLHFDLVKEESSERERMSAYLLNCHVYVLSAHVLQHKKTTAAVDYCCSSSLMFRLLMIRSGWSADDAYHLSPVTPVLIHARYASPTAVLLSLLLLTVPLLCTGVLLFAAVGCGTAVVYSSDDFLKVRATVSLRPAVCTHASIATVGYTTDVHKQTCVTAVYYLLHMRVTHPNFCPIRNYHPSGKNVVLKYLFSESLLLYRTFRRSSGRIREYRSLCADKLSVSVCLIAIMSPRP